jgi:UDP-N-acetylbacillosamine N-acetyltransferase
VTAGLLILGFGGHARSVADVALASGVRSLIFVDENAHDGESFLGFPVQREFRGALPDGWQCMPASGDNALRASQIEAAYVANWRIATLIAPSATVGIGAIVNEGSFIAQHVHIGPMAKIGVGCIINTGAVIDHESVVGDYTHVSVNSTVAGRCQIGSFVFLGSGSTVIDRIKIADYVTLGAGGVAVKSIDRAGTYVGVPAKRLDTGN